MCFKSGEQRAAVLRIPGSVISRDVCCCIRSRYLICGLRQRSVTGRRTCPTAGANYPGRGNGRGATGRAGAASDRGNGAGPAASACHAERVVSGKVPMRFGEFSGDLHQLRISTGSRMADDPHQFTDSVS